MAVINGTNLIASIARSVLAGAFMTVAVCTILAQSSDQAFPTAVTENQLTGQIKARDIGDARLTTYYFTFNGTQGDLFINLVTKNLSGSIDVFTADGMRPLTKILVYADLSASETGRVIYLRKPEKLILRVEGRTPNDDPAEFQIKFAGGFEAAVPRTDEPPVPKVGDLPPNESGVRVNSVGTIIAVIPKPTPSPKAESEEVAKREEPAPEKVEEKPSVVENKESEELKPETKTSANTTKPSKTTTRRNTRSRATAKTPVKIQPAEETKKSEIAAETETKKEPEKIEKSTKPTKKPSRVVVTDSTAKLPPSTTTQSNPLANVNLVIMFKDGTKVQRPMTEVLRFTADQTTLTIINKNGRIAKFSILEVASVTIQ